MIRKDDITTVIDRFQFEPIDEKTRTELEYCLKQLENESFNMSCNLTDKPSIAVYIHFKDEIDATAFRLT